MTVEVHDDPGVRRRGLKPQAVLLAICIPAVVLLVAFPEPAPDASVEPGASDPGTFWAIAATQAAAQKDWATMQGHIDRGRELEGGSEAVLLMQGWLEESRGAHAKARRVYAAALDVVTDRDRQRAIRCSIADLWRREGKLPAARMELDALERELGSDERSGRTRVLLLLDEGNRERALNVTIDLAERYPGSDQLRRLLTSLDRTQAGSPGSTD